MDKWAEYQSLLQLAAGANLGVTASLLIFGNAISSLRHQFDAHEKSVRHFRRRLDGITDGQIASNIANSLRALESETRALESSLRKAEVRRAKIAKWMTPFGILSGIASLYLLYLSSANNSPLPGTIEDSGTYLLIFFLVVFPFLAMVGAAIDFFVTERKQGALLRNAEESRGRLYQQWAG